MTRVLIIIAASISGEVNEAIRTEGIDPGSEDAITVPLWPVGQNQTNAPSHYWASWNMTDEQLAKFGTITNQFQPIYVLPYNLDANPGFPQAKLGELGLTTATGGPL